VDDHLNEFSYDADLAGLGYSLNRDGDGLFLAAYGFNDKLHVLLEKLVKGMRNNVVKQERFDVIKEALVRGLQNWRLNAPYDHAMHYTKYLLTSGQWTNAEKEEALQGLCNISTLQILIFRDSSERCASFYSRVIVSFTYRVIDSWQCDERRCPQTHSNCAG
jgi:insulysin